LLEDVLVRNELWQLGPCSLLCWLLVRHASVLARGCLRWGRVGQAEAWWQVEPGRGEWAKHAGRGGAKAPQEEEEAEGEEEGEAEGQQS
jgi:hypothetical protein